MNPFRFVQASDAPAAIAALSVAGEMRGRFIAGGTNLLDLMKENIAQVPQLVDINGLALRRIELADDGSLHLGALARNADTAYHPLVKQHAPLLSAAILAGASPQIRNMASNGGNLLQRTRCVYFYDAGVPCNKRAPGSGCPAVKGLARNLAILGTSQACIATHPSDMCVALRALDAVVKVQSPRGERDIAFADFHRLPDATPDIDNQLAPDELITKLVLPPVHQFAAHSVYLKLRERASYAFALVSVAAALDLDSDGRIRAVRIALGGVAHKPWRVESAEAAMVGELPQAAVFENAAERILQGAQAFGVGPGHNGFKIAMARRAVVRALETAAQGTPTNQFDDTADDANPDESERTDA
jgi:xanthine dehydrogenase YagS FAD-binding subunit